MDKKKIKEKLREVVGILSNDEFQSIIKSVIEKDIEKLEKKGKDAGVICCDNQSNRKFLDFPFLHSKESYLSSLCERAKEIIYYIGYLYLDCAEKDSLYYEMAILSDIHYCLSNIRNSYRKDIKGRKKSSKTPLKANGHNNAEAQCAQGDTGNGKK